jgi:hypothetical protein
MNKIIPLIILVISSVSCAAPKISTSTQNSDEPFKELVANKLGEDVLYITNTANSYVLCINEKKGTAQQPRNMILYLVVKLDNNSIVLEDKIEGGNVSWASKNEIEVFRTPGIVRKDQSRADFITLYNVETGKSYTKNNRQTH